MWIYHLVNHKLTCIADSLKLKEKQLHRKRKEMACCESSYPSGELRASWPSQLSQVENHGERPERCRCPETRGMGLISVDSETWHGRMLRLTIRINSVTETAEMCS